MLVEADVGLLFMGLLAMGHASKGFTHLGEQVRALTRDCNARIYQFIPTQPVTSYTCIGRRTHVFSILQSPQT